MEAPRVGGTVFKRKDDPRGVDAFLFSLLFLLNGNIPAINSPFS